MDDFLTRLRDLVSQPATIARHIGIWSLLGGEVEEGLWSVAFDYIHSHGLMGREDLVSCERQRRAAVEKEPWFNERDGHEMIWVEGGSYLSGKEKREVFLLGYSMGRHPVTNRQYAHFLNETGYEPDERHASRDYYLSHWEGELCPAELLDSPVVYISWIDAVHYCGWAGLILPTVEMWEKAARGRDGRRFPWGNQVPKGERCVWAHLGKGGPVPVGRYSRMRTAYGCQDMIGNVWEFCQPSSGGLVYRFEEVSFEGGYVQRRVPLCGAGVFDENKEKMTCYGQETRSRIRREPRVGFRPAYVPTFKGD